MRYVASKTVAILALFCSTLSGAVQARGVFIKAGANYSYLRTPSYSKARVGHLFGIGKDWSLYRCIQLRTEFMISKSNTVLRNKTVQSSYYVRSFPRLPDEPVTIRYYDLEIGLEYTEVPLLLAMERRLTHNLSVGFELGYSLKFLRKDESKLTFLKAVKSTHLTEKDRQSFRFDFRFTGISENYSYHGRGLCPTLGMYCLWRKFRLTFRYQVDHIDWVSSVVLGDDVPLRIFSLSIGYGL